MNINKELLLLQQENLSVDEQAKLKYQKKPRKSILGQVNIALFFQLIGSTAED